MWEWGNKMSGTARQATDRVAAEDELRRRDALFEIIANNSSDVIVAAGMGGLVRYVSPGCRKLTGYEPDDLTGPLSLDLVHPQDRARLAAVLANLATGAGTAEYRIRRKDGSYRWLESTIKLLYDPASGQPIEVLAISRDVAARKQAEEKTTVVEAAANAMIMVGSDGRIVLVNNQTEKLFGYDRRELLGQPIEMLMPAQFRAHHAGHRDGFFAGPATRTMGAGRDLSGVRKDGSEIQVEIGLNPVSTSEGQFVLASIIDITGRKEEEQRVQLLLRMVVEGVHDYGIFLLDPAGYVLNWNDGAQRLEGYAADENVGQHFSHFYTAEDVSAGEPANALRVARTGKFEGEGWRLRRDGSRFWASVVITALLDKNGSLRGFLKLTRDISDRSLAEERLRESERSLRLMADAMPQIVWTTGPDGHRDYYNRRWYELTGTAEGEEGDEPWESIVHPDDIQQRRDNWRSAVESGSPYETQFRIRANKTGEYRWHLARAVALRDEQGAITRWVGTLTDIDDQKRFSQQLEQRVEERTRELQGSLTEKTTLLKEVHHRVKNNLQVVGSLLSMQIESLEDRALAEPLNNAYWRVLAMSLIHEQLYQSENLGDLNFGAYVELLADRLFSGYCVDPDRVRLDLSVEPIPISVHRAIPCGLILNELLSNSLKHAFKDGRDGVIRISLRKTSDDSIELEVTDNGIGFPADFRWEEGRSLGLQVVRTLVHQIRADLFVSGEGGATFRLRWRVAEEEGGVAALTPEPAGVTA
jgi:PAS domain S-box-containing protein